jgi:hypothetical protein
MRVSATTQAGAARGLATMIAVTDWLYRSHASVSAAR